jgi:hypothetical protein
MSICRALLAAAAVVTTLQAAEAQFDGLPGIPGVPKGSPPSARPPQCQTLLAIRAEAQKDRAAMQAARSKRADATVACKLIQKYLTTVAELLKRLDADGPSCGVRPIDSQVQRDQPSLRRMGLQACDAANSELRMFRLDRGPEPWWTYETR